MSFQGFYTTKGLALAAKLAAGTKLTITKVTAGSGETAKTAATLAQEQQTLTAGTAAVSGQSAVLPVTLAKTGVSAAYSLTELGVYAQDPDAGVILFQVFRMDKPIPLTAGGENAYRFYLKQTVGAAGISVTCSPAGLLIDEDLDPLRSTITALAARVNATDISTRAVTVAAAELQAYIDALPRLLTEQITVKVTGTLSDSLYIQGFYGSGALTIQGPADINNQILLSYCSVPITLRDLQITSPASFTANSCVVTAVHCSCYFDSCAFTGNGQGIAVDLGMGPYDIAACTMSGFRIAVLARRSGVVTVRDGSYSNNVCGAQPYYGGVILLCGTAPDLLGGAANVHMGGIIAKSDGTLI